MPRPIALMTLTGPLGPYHVAATADGVVAGEWLTTEGAFLAGLRARFDAAVTVSGPPRARLDAAREPLEALLRGEPVETADIAVDLADRPAWDRRVLAAVRDLAWGETASYGGIARRIGAPRAARPVGRARGRTPNPLLFT